MVRLQKCIYVSSTVVGHGQVKKIMPITMASPPMKFFRSLGGCVVSGFSNVCRSATECTRGGAPVVSV